MPAWLISMLISLALKFGLPWIMSRFPHLQERFPIIWQILQDVTKKVDDGVITKAEAHQEAHSRIKQECFGICPVDTKKP